MPRLRRSKKVDTKIKNTKKIILVLYSFSINKDFFNAFIKIYYLKFILFKILQSTFILDFDKEG